MAERLERKLVLDDGNEYYGEGFGSSEDKLCELIFDTSMVGTQELISDPAYLDKMVILTYPVAGSYGINDDDFCSRGASPAALVVRKYNDDPSNFRCTATLAEYMEDNRISGISGVDTRELTRKIREKGACRAMLTNADTDREKALEAIRAYVPDERPAERISCKKRWIARPSRPSYSVAVIDLGLRSEAIKQLKLCGCNVTVLPFNVCAEQVRAIKPDGVYISAGPGNPEKLEETIALINSLRGELTICGEGLGFQLICLACGAKIFKLHHGIYGGSHPVRELASGKIASCPQGRDFGVDAVSLADTSLKPTHEDVADGSLMGAEDKKTRCFGVQYISGGEGESYKTLFERFVSSMKEARENA